MPRAGVGGTTGEAGAAVAGLVLLRVMVAKAAATDGKTSSEMPEPAVTAMRRRWEEIPEGAKASTVLGLRKRRRRLTWERRARRRSSLLLAPPPAARGTFILVIVCAVCVCVVCKEGRRACINKAARYIQKMQSEFP